jgi:hypothetical protein
MLGFAMRSSATPWRQPSRPRVELTARERDALGHIRPGALAAFQRYLDGKWIRDWIEEVSA